MEILQIGSNSVHATTPTIEYAASADAVQIGYERLGRGPALVLVQGAMGTAFSFRQLAESLADAFTVIVPDRRGRGRSPHPYSAGYTIDDDIRDLEAVLAASGARRVFGLSSGGDIALRAALELPQIDALALYEPAVFPNGVPRDSIRRFETYASNGDLAGVLVTGMKVAEQGPGFMRALPDWLLKPALRHIMRQERRQGSGEYASMADLAAAFRYDFAVVTGMDGSIPTFSALTQPVLLLGGSRSPRYLRQALDQLERTIPDSTRVELDGLDHAAAWNIDEQRNPGGDPKAVADQLKRFFLPAQ